MEETNFDPEAEIKRKITILLADDHPLLRKALRLVLEEQADFEVIAEVDDGEEAVTQTTKLLPDLVIMDIGMPKLNGIEATRRIKAKCPQVAILVLTVYDDSEHIWSIIEAGASSYLTKSVFGDNVVNAVRSASSGDTVLSKSILKQVIKHDIRHAIKPLPMEYGDKITPRELQILKEAARGTSNMEIAQILGLSLPTVKGYMAEIFQKLSANSRTNAVITALRIGILSLEDLG